MYEPYTPHSNLDGYINLANAIIAQAARDYKGALRLLRRNPNNKTALPIKEEVEDFFRSEWFAGLTGVDPELLLSRLAKEVRG